MKTRLCILNSESDAGSVAHVADAASIELNSGSGLRPQLKTRVKVVSPEKQTKTKPHRPGGTVVIILFLAEAMFSKKRNSINLIAFDSGLAKFGGVSFEFSRA